jgi:GxxExxY protein
VNALSRGVVEAAFAVHAALGAGYAESVYEEALCWEMESRRLAFVRQPVFSIQYKGKVVGTQRLDVLAGGSIIVELKAVDRLADVHFAQVLSYLKATRLELGLLINFNVPHLRTGIRRVIHTCT